VGSLVVRAVVFDLDGTLVSFNVDYRAIRADVLGLLARQGLPRSIFSLREGVFDTLAKAELYMRNRGRGGQEFQRVKNGVLSVVVRHEMEAARATVLVPGALETLKALRESGLRTALFTVNGEAPTNHILRRFRLGDLFDAVVTRESAPSVKPNPGHLEAVLRKLGVEPGEALVVGDSVHDVRCALGLGVTAVGVATGISSPEDLTRAGATRVISSLTELPALVGQLGSS